jgi:predicted amidophosphoribosyltransferase
LVKGDWREQVVERSYDQKAIAENILAQWEENKFSLLRYFSKKSQKNNEATELILAFKENWQKAVKIASKLMSDHLGQYERHLKEKLRCRYIVAAPPHSQGKASVGSEYMCATLAARFPFLTHLEGALERTKTVQKAAYAHPGQRPGYEEHLESIKYSGPKLDLRKDSVILFDDVLTKGSTSDACGKIIQDATRSVDVIGIFLGRTQ